MRVVTWVNDSTGFIYAKDAEDNSNYLYRTTNTGEDWQIIDLQLPESHYTDLIHDIHFNDAGIGIMTGKGGFIAKSEDMGLTWDIRNSPSLPLNGIQFTDDQHGFATQGSDVVKTEDGGRNWEPIQGLDSLYVYGLELEDQNNGLLYGYRNYNYTLTNGVIKQLDLPVGYFLNTIFTRKGNTIYGVGLAYGPFRPVVIQST